MAIIGLGTQVMECARVRQLIDERRLVIRLKVDRLYGTALDIND